MERSILFKRGVDDVFGATAIIRLGPPRFLRFIDRSQLDPHPVGHFGMSGQPIAEAASYAIQNRNTRRKFTSSAGFEPVIPACEWP